MRLLKSCVRCSEGSAFPMLDCTALMTSGEVMRRCVRLSSFTFHASVCVLLFNKDMRLSGCALAEILRAGQWRSAAFIAYLNQIDLEKVQRCAQVL